MTGAVVVALVLLLALAWFFWPSTEGRRDIDPNRRPGVDQAELDAAEREVQEAPDQDSVRDWGPGSGMQKPIL